MSPAMRRSGSISLLTTLLVLAAIVLSAETLPSQLSDAEYWKMINDFSEPAGYYQYNVITSNETSYQYSIPDLMKTPRAGGAYLGVGPEQNFTYIAALQPKIDVVAPISAPWTSRARSAWSSRLLRLRSIRSVRGRAPPRRPPDLRDEGNQP